MISNQIQRKMTEQIDTEILINAEPKKIWKILTDFENYADWNSFVTSIEGNVKIGNTIKVKIEPENGNGMTFQPVVIAFNPEKELRRLGKLFIKGLLDGEHQFKLIDNQDGTTTFFHTEIFSGLLVSLFKTKLTSTKKDFERMNIELKQLAED